MLLCHHYNVVGGGGGGIIAGTETVSVCVCVLGGGYCKEVNPVSQT